MKKELVQKFIGKKCLVVLSNNYSYTGVIPDFEDESFNLIDKFGEEIGLECAFIQFIHEVKDD